MSRRHDALDSTIKVFKDARLEPTVKRGRHIKVRAGKITAVLSATPSDHRVAIKARAVARRLVRGRQDEPKTNSGQALIGGLVSHPQQVSNAALLVRQRAEEKARAKETQRIEAEATRQVRIEADKRRVEQEALERARLQAKADQRFRETQRGASTPAMSVEERRQTKLEAKKLRDEKRRFETELALAAHIHWIFTDYVKLYRAMIKDWRMTVNYFNEEHNEEDQSVFNVPIEFIKLDEYGGVGEEGMKNALLRWSEVIKEDADEDGKPYYMPDEEWQVHMSEVVTYLKNK
jgi:hypothetical protein